MRVLIAICVLDTNRTRLVRKARPIASFFNFFSPPLPPSDEAIENGDLEEDELEEEKEELKEFQEMEKERRCLEYAMHQRDLEEVGAALEEIEEERRGELHSANIRREQYTDREKQVQVSLSVHSWPAYVQCMRPIPP